MLCGCCNEHNRVQCDYLLRCYVRPLRGTGLGVMSDMSSRRGEQACGTFLFQTICADKLVKADQYAVSEKPFIVD